MLIVNWEQIIPIIENERLPFGYEIPTRGKMKKI